MDPHARHPAYPASFPDELELGMRVGSKHDSTLQVVKSLLLESIKQHFFLQ